MNSPIQLPPNAWKKGVAIPFGDGNFPIESIPLIYCQTTDELTKSLAEEFFFFRGYQEPLKNESPRLQEGVQALRPNWRPGRWKF